MIGRALRCWKSVLAAHVVLLAFAFAFALPLAGALSRGVADRAEGDLALWHEGGIFLADTMASDRAPSIFAARGALLGAALWAISALPLSAGLFATLRVGRDLGAGTFARVATRRAGAFFVVFVAWLVLAAVVVGLGGLAASKVVEAFAEAPDPRRGLLLGGLAALPFACVLLLAASATDVARSALAAGPGRPLGTLATALKAALVRPLRFGAPYAAFGLAQVALLVVAAQATTRLGGRPGLAAVAVVLVGQTTLFARALLRAAWMGAAARLADSCLDHPRAGS